MMSSAAEGGTGGCGAGEAAEGTLRRNPVRLRLLGLGKAEMWRAGTGGGVGLGLGFGGREARGRRVLGGCWSDIVAGGGESGSAYSINLGFTRGRARQSHGRLCASVICGVEDGNARATKQPVYAFQCRIRKKRAVHLVVLRSRFVNYIIFRDAVIRKLIITSWKAELLVTLFSVLKRKITLFRN